MSTLKQHQAIELEPMTDDVTDRSRQQTLSSFKTSQQQQPPIALYSRKQKIIALTLALTMTLAFVANIFRTNAANDKDKTNHNLIEQLTTAMDVMGNDTCDMRLKAPFTAIVSGPTGSGKTQLLTRLIKQARSISNPSPEEIIYCYGAYQQAFVALEPYVTFHEGPIDVLRDIPNDGKHRWLILDDLMSEAGNSSEMTSLYTKHSHHRNISVFFVLQNLFWKGGRTMSINSHYFFLFKNPRDNTIVTNLAKQMYPGNVRFLTEAYKDATKKPYSYLMIDVKQNTRDKCRVISGFATDKMYAYEETSHVVKRKR